jgi:hypothetical protein
MLTPEYLDTLPDAAAELWRQVEDDILQDIARRIGQLDELEPLTPTAAWQAWRYEQVQACHKDALGIIAKYSGRSRDVIRRTMLDAGLQTLASDDALYTALGFAPSAVDTNEALNNLLNAGYRQTLGSWQNLTATTAHTVTGEFERALDRAWLQVSSGAFSYQTVIRRTVDSLAAHMDGVTYPSGHRDTLEVAVRRAVLTGTNQTCAKLQLARAEEIGCEYVEVSAHAGARPEHAVWQGKVYHVGGAAELDGVWYEDFETATGYGTGPGLCGWNCRHSFYPFFPGVSRRLYDQAELDRLAAKSIEYGGEKYTEYEIRQMQRALERKVRDAKRRYLAEKAAGVDTTRAALRLRDTRRALNAFIEATGGKLSAGRTDVAGFGPGDAKATTQQVRDYTNIERFQKENLAQSEEDLLPGYEGAIIPGTKLNNYLLNPDHPRGGGKAVAFRDVLGYTKENAQELSAALQAGLKQWKASARPVTKYGRPYEVKMLLTGPSGRQATVKTGWIVESDGKPRLTSAYIYKGL